MDPKRIHILGEMPVPRAIVALAAPTVLAMVVQMLYNLADTFFVGLMNDPMQVAAVSLSMPVFMILMAIGGVFGNGGASYLSRLLGQGEYRAAKEVATVSTVLCVITAVGLSILGLSTLPTILGLIGASPETAAPAAAYLRVILLGSPLMMVNFAMNQLLRAEGAARVNMMGMIVGTVINIALDPVFILLFGWGVTGAAVATLIGNAGALAYYARYFRRTESYAAPARGCFRLRKSSLREILGIGFPSSLSQVMMSVGSALANGLAARYDDYHVAALGVGMRVISIPIFVFIGLAMGIQPLIGYCYGARNRERLKEVSFTALRYGLVLAVIGMAGFALFSRPLVLAFIRDERVVGPGVLVLHAMIFALPFAAMQMQFMVTLQAMGKALSSLVVAISRQGLVYIPALVALNVLFGFNGIVFALPLADFITTVLAFILLRIHTARMEHAPVARESQ